MNVSRIEQRGPVPFPPFTGERHYMRPFTKRDGLPADLAHWQPTVDAMLDGVDAPGPIYIMIHQKDISPGTSHRRPGLHIDGYWIPSIQAHGGGQHVAGPGAWDNDNKWKHCNFATPEALVLASDVAASRAYAGPWQGAPGKGGDCAHIDTAGLLPVVLQAGVAYVGNVTMLHESLPVMQPTRRTLVRLNVPGWSI